MIGWWGNASRMAFRAKSDEGANVICSILWTELMRIRHLSTLMSGFCAAVPLFRFLFIMHIPDPFLLAIWILQADGFCRESKVAGQFNYRNNCTIEGQEYQSSSAEQERPWLIRGNNLTVGVKSDDRHRRLVPQHNSSRLSRMKFKKKI